MKTSILICSRNREEKLIRCLSSIKKQTVLPDELVLVEDVAENKFFSQRKLEKFFNGKLKCLYTSIKNGNYAISRNLSIRKASGDILISIDDDVTIEKQSVHDLICLHKRFPRALGFVGKIKAVKRNLFTEFSAFYFNNEMHNAANMTQVSCFPFCMISLRKSILAKHHFAFDESLNTGEDVDFLLRLYKRGEKLYFHPKLQIEHEFKGDIFSFARQYFGYAQDFASLYKKHPNHIELEKYYPGRKLHWLLFPFFIPARAFSLASDFIKKFHVRFRLLFPAVCHHLSIFAGLYLSREGYILLRRNFSDVFLKKADPRNEY